MVLRILTGRRITGWNETRQSTETPSYKTTNVSLQSHFILMSFDIKRIEGHGIHSLIGTKGAEGDTRILYDIVEKAIKIISEEDQIYHVNKQSKDQIYHVKKQTKILVSCSQQTARGRFLSPLLFISYRTSLSVPRCGFPSTKMLSGAPKRTSCFNTHRTSSLFLPAMRAEDGRGGERGSEGRG